MLRVLVIKHHFFHKSWMMVLMLWVLSPWRHLNCTGALWVKNIMKTNLAGCARWTWEIPSAYIKHQDTMPLLNNICLLLYSDDPKSPLEFDTAPLYLNIHRNGWYLWILHCCYMDYGSYLLNGIDIVRCHIIVSYHVCVKDITCFGTVNLFVCKYVMTCFAWFIHTARQLCGITIVVRPLCWV